MEKTEQKIRIEVEFVAQVTTDEIEYEKASEALGLVFAAAIERRVRDLNRRASTSGITTLPQEIRIVPESINVVDWVAEPHE